VPLAGSVTTLGAELTSGAAGLSAAASGSGCLNLRGVPVDASPTASFVFLNGEGGALDSCFAARGDSRMGWFCRLVMVIACAVVSAKIFLFSCMGAGSERSVSPLSLREVEMLESWLIPRCKPILPSFSIAMKSVRTLERGRGDSPPITELQVAPLAPSVWSK
jgi:hypothetical protein